MAYSEQAPLLDITTERRKWYQVPSWVPLEVKDLLVRSLPLVFALILQLMFNVTVTIFVGRLGEVELAGTGLALTVLSFTQMGMAQGMSTACDTLFSQAYGANKKKLIGIHLQRSLMFALLFILVAWSMFLVVEPCVTTIGIDPAVARLTGQYLLYYMPGLFFNVIFQILSKYLITQYYVTQVTVMTLIGNVVNVGAHLLFVTYLGYGTRGSAMALDVASTSLTVIVLIYILYTRLYTDTWSGWSAEAFYDWHIFAKYALPGMAMLSFEYIGYEIGAVLAGILGPVYLSSITVYSQIGPFMFTIYNAFAVSCSFRVGGKLGSDDVQGAIRCTRVTYGAAFLIGFVVMVTMTLLKYELPKIITNDPAVIAMSADMLQMNAAYSIAMAVSTQQCGVLRGCGRQVVGAIVHLIGYFVLCVPIGSALMFLTPLEAVGFFYGLVAAFYWELAILSALLWFTDWQKQAEQARCTIAASSASTESRTSLPILHGGSRLALPFPSRENLDVLAEQTSARIPLLAPNTVPKKTFKRAPRRKCTLNLLLKRAATFGLLLLIFFTAVGWKIKSELNRTQGNVTVTIN